MECWACQHVNLHSLVRINESTMRRKAPALQRTRKTAKNGYKIEF